MKSLLSIDFTITRLTYKHSATITLSDSEEYALCAVGGTVNLELAGVVLPMLIVDVGRVRALDSWVYSVSLESPGAVLDYPFAGQMSGFLLGTGSSIATDLAGTTPLLWNTVDWPISGELLDASERTPRELISLLAGVPGGVLRSEFDGSLTVEPDYPLPVTQWSAAAADHVINMVTQSVGDSVDGELTPLYNGVYVGSSASDNDSTTVSIKTESQDDGSVLVRVYTYPWDNGLDFSQTGGAAVSVELVGDVVRELTEVAEVVGGEGSVPYPVHSLVSYSYMADDLGGLDMDGGGSFSTAVADESLISITYQTKSRDFLVRSATGDDLQVVAECADDAGVDDEIFVFRGSGNSLGDAIYDQLLTSEAVRRERGRNFIDASCSLRETVTINVDFTQLYRPGSLIAVNDPVDGQWVGLLQEQSGTISVTDGNLSVSSVLTIERVQR